jgi:hypothetical protein
MPNLIPNSYQTPNAYIDLIYAFLTADEWKVLSYALRRIIGFDKREDRISLSQFTDGATLKNGEARDYGTGLGRDTVRKSLQGLLQYGLMVKLEENDPTKNEGPLFALQLDFEKVDIDGLRQRFEQYKTAQAGRTASAIAARSSKATPNVSHTGYPVCPTDRPPYVPQTAPRMSDILPQVCETDRPPYVAQTTPGMSDIHTKPSLNPVLNSEKKEEEEIYSSFPKEKWALVFYEYITSALGEKIGRAEMQNWVLPAKAVDWDKTVLRVACINTAGQQRLSNRYAAMFSDELSKFVGRRARVEFVLRPEVFLVKKEVQRG